MIDPRTDHDDRSPSTADLLRGGALATGVLALVTLLIAFASRVGDLPLTWDEPFMQPVVAAIGEQNWSRASTIDFEDTKGPAFFWVYAAAAEVVGGEIHALRWITRLLFVLIGLPLGAIGAACGLRRSAIALLALFAALLPYNAALGQLFMSEPSFLLGAAALGLVTVLGAADRAGRWRLFGPLLFGVLSAILLHHRPHIVAHIGAALLVLAAARGRACWPWWIAGAIAGASRLPLYLHWGGLVSPEYQGRMGLGLRFESVTYLAISLIPVTALCLWPAWRGRGRVVILGAASAGAVLGAFAVPDLDITNDGARYLGMVATALRPLAESTGFRFAVILGAAAGGAGLAATGVLAVRARASTVIGATERLAALTLVLGWMLYGLTRGDVYDRYQVAFTLLLPVIWIRHCPRWLLVVEGLGLAALLLRLGMTWGLW